MFVLICIATCVVLFTKQIYYFDINYLHITDYVNLSVEKIKENYNVLIHYQSFLYKGDLVFPDFIMSESGAKHFREVKVVFEIMQYVALGGGLAGLALAIKKYKDKDYQFFKSIAITTFIVPLIIGFLASINFDRAFTLFHQIVFRNNDWLFNYRTDPIILILPEDFFMHCFILIIVVVWILCLINYIIGKKLEKKWLS